MKLAITGMALASPFGTDEDAFWRGLCEGPAPIHTWRSAFPELECLAALLPDAGAGTPAARATALALDLARRALAAAGYAAAPPGAGLALGSHWAELDFLADPPLPPPPELLATVVGALGLDGPAVNTSVACAAGNTAIAWAADRVRAGDAPLMIAGGLDLIGPVAVGGYQLLDNLTHTLPRPFGAGRDGFLLGEGGAMFVLEPAGARARAELLGVGSSHDAAHPTRPPDDGRGVIRALRAALADAGLTPADIDYINAHSPGTLANDRGEAAAYRAVFGAGAVPVSSTKAALGHAQGGANALEAAACVLALERQAIPPTLCTVEAEPHFGLDLVVGAARPARLARVISAASSMGGANAVLVLGRCG